MRASSFFILVGFVADLHTTLLHQLELDHDQLPHHHNGRETLMDSVVSDARVVSEIIA